LPTALFPRGDCNPDNSIHKDALGKTPVMASEDALLNARGVASPRGTNGCMAEPDSLAASWGERAQWFY